MRALLLRGARDGEGRKRLVYAGEQHSVVSAAAGRVERRRDRRVHPSTGVRACNVRKEIEVRGGSYGSVAEAGISATDWRSGSPGPSRSKTPNSDRLRFSRSSCHVFPPSIRAKKKGKGKNGPSQINGGDVTVDNRSSAALPPNRTHRATERWSRRDIDTGLRAAPRSHTTKGSKPEESQCSPKPNAPRRWLWAGFWLFPPCRE
jgi:hypothetical protein